jgi:hypothetical protein
MMPHFERTLTSSALDTLRKMAIDAQPSWWKDLLSLWRPSGMPVEKYGLRLALRDGYLNFYRYGQSVAKVWMSAIGAPVGDIHIKYALGPWETTDYSKVGNAYARLEGNRVYHNETGRCANYEDIHTLHKWIDEANRHKGREKIFVDNVVEENPSIIDLEMGLPAWNEVRTAPRMDMVALEVHAERAVRIVFWEAKLIRNGELVSRTVPQVVRQLGKYVAFLAGAERCDHVVNAYRTTCRVLTELHETATLLHQKANDTIRLSDLDILVRRAAGPNSDLRIDRVPRLAIFDNGSRSKNWASHEKRLRDEYRIPVIVYVDPPPYKLPSQEPFV